MAFDFRAFKAQMKPKFHNEYGKFYPVKSLESVGFKRRVCTSCGRGFWSMREREHCDEPACSGGYRFIGKKLTKKPFKYRQAWDEYVKTFQQWDYVPIARYPVVCRWYEDLYFVNAGINDFQPYVVSGEVEPPAPAVLEPQFCLRFSDIDSVGITGRHYSGFIMVGQHTFNTEKRHVYFKDEGILQIHEFLTRGLGIDPREICYHEDVWAGGGNFGPSMEFFSGGLELGNQVYMQYEVLPDGSSRELKTKVIDMGAGLERWAWFSQGTSMSYDSTFPEVMDYIYRASGIKPEPKFMERFGHFAGLIDLEEADDITSTWAKIAKELGLDQGELKRRAYEMRALYSIADHTRTLLVAIHDGALPSNVGGGYNLRNILRRCLSQIDEYNLNIELEKVFEKHIHEFGSWHTELQDVGSLYDIISVEKSRYRETREKGSKIIEKEGEITVEKMVELYDSHGIPPDMVSQYSNVPVPDNFYKLVEERHQKKTEKEDKKQPPQIPDNLPDTEAGYHESQETLEFTAKILHLSKNHVVLDKTHFYPEGGGQEADNGTIAGKKVLYVEKAGKVVVHTLEDTDGLSVGAQASCRLDDKRRRQLMQHHSATHIVNAAAKSVLGPHIWQAGAHKSEQSSRLDITHYKAVSEDELKKIQTQANKYVSQSHEIRIQWMKRNEAEAKYGMSIYQGGAVPGTEIRVVNVVGVDVEACGGTHLKNTSEIGEIKMLSAKRIQDGVVRLEFTAGKASKKIQNQEGETLEKIKDILNAKKPPEDLKKICAIFSVQPEKAEKTISRFMQENEEAIKEIRNLGGKPHEMNESDEAYERAISLFESWKKNRKTLDALRQSKSEKIAKEISSLLEKEHLLKYKTDGMDIKNLMDSASKAVEDTGKTIIILNKSGDKANIVVASGGDADAGEICKKLSTLLGGGGGGGKKTAIGGGNYKNAEKTLEEFKT
jgi:alanyl-tRNA synthetase